jgi:hypothetical protein
LSRHAYRHTQPATALRWTFGLIALFAGAAAVATDVHLIAWPVLAVLLVVLLNLHALTVEIGGGEIKLSFGIGFIHKRFPVARVRDAQVVRNRWYYGWGIRWTPHGWLFNVSGLDAVQIRMDDDRTYRIGTDEPLRLRAALKQAIGSR